MEKNTVFNAPPNRTVFSEQCFQILYEAMTQLNVPKNEYIYWEGDGADKLFYVIKGQVKIRKTAEDGKSLVLYVFHKNDFFGQINPFLQTNHSFSAIAAEDSVLGIIERDELGRLLWQHRELSLQFIQWMGLMQRLAETKIRDLLMHGKMGALASTLIRLSHTYGEKSEHEIKISRRIPHTELAEMVGATRESVNRMLGELRKTGTIRMEGPHIVIQNLGELQTICQCERCPIEVCRI